MGRDSEIGDVSDLLGKARLVTLTGVAGIGKTRLALEVGARVADRYPGGVWLAELDADAQPPVVAHVVADALGVAEQPGSDLVDSVIEHLGERRLLLILDNCEHVVAACAELATALLRACADLSLLATSQQPLGVSGERVWPVPPMSLPPPGDDPGAAALEESEAVKLFCERAVAARGSFSLSAEAASAVAHMCRRLDGIPLAIELAAARTALYGLGEVARVDGDEAQAASVHHQALMLHHQVGDPAGVVDSIEALARLSAKSGRHPRAARLLGAAQSLRDADHVRYVRPPLQRGISPMRKRRRCARHSARPISMPHGSRERACRSMRRWILPHGVEAPGSPVPAAGRALPGLSWRWRPSSNRASPTQRSARGCSSRPEPRSAPDPHLRQARPQVPPGAGQRSGPALRRTSTFRTTPSANGRMHAHTYIEEVGTMTEDKCQEQRTAYLRQAAAARHAMEDPEAPSGDAARDPVFRAEAAAHGLQRLVERFTRLDEVMEKAERAVDAAAAVAVAQEAGAPTAVLERLQLEQREKQFAFRRSINDIVTGDADLPTILAAYANLSKIAAEAT